MREGLFAKDPQLTLEALQLVSEHVAGLAKRRARFLLSGHRFEDARQSVLELVLRWRDEGKLRPEESFFELTSRALKQVAEKFARDVHWQKLAASLDAPPPSGSGESLVAGEAATAVHAPRRFGSPEKVAADREMLRWIGWAEEQLSEDDRRVVDALLAVHDGQAASLGAALGVTDVAARKRHQRLRERYARLAVAEGNPEMAERCAGKKYAEALETLYVAEPGGDHRLEELVLLRDGELPTGQRLELEKHVAGCAGCKRTLRTLETVDEALAVLLVWRPEGAGGTGSSGPSRAPKVAGVAAAALAVLGAVVWFVRPAPPPAPPPPPVAPPFPAPRPRPVPQPLLSAPSLPEPPEAAPDAGRAPRRPRR